MGVVSLPAVHTDPAKILKFRHDFYGTWLLVANELDYNKGVLCAVANGKRKASHELIDRMNERYGLKLKYTHIKITVTPCPTCGAIPNAAKHRCPQSAPKYKPHPVMRLSKLRRLMQSPYNAA